MQEPFAPFAHRVGHQRQDQERASGDAPQLTMPQPRPQPGRCDRQADHDERSRDGHEPERYGRANLDPFVRLGRVHDATHEMCCQRPQDHQGQAKQPGQPPADHARIITRNVRERSVGLTCMNPQGGMGGLFRWALRDHPVLASAIDGQSDGVRPFGVAALAFMLATYALESRGRGNILAFAVGCALSSAYGFWSGAWPFGAVEAIWCLVATRRFALAANR
jgi:hypothetical protein